MLPGNKISPAVAAVNIIDPCINIGKISSEANMVIIMIKNIMTACVYMGNLKTRKSIMGSVNLNCLIANSPIPIKPIRITVYTFGARKPISLSPAELNTYIIAPKPIDENKIKTISSYGLVSYQTITKFLYEYTIINIYTI